MSEGEVAGLRRMIGDLSDKTDRQHQDNQTAQRADREAFAEAMSRQRDVFQEALNKQFLMHVDLSGQVRQMDTKLTLCIGSGQPGEGRLGSLEETVEMLKKFRWQALALLTGVLWLADRITPLFGKH